MLQHMILTIHADADMKWFTTVLRSKTGLLTQSRTLWNSLTRGWGARSHAQKERFQNVKFQTRSNLTWCFLTTSHLVNI